MDKKKQKLAEAMTEKTGKKVMKRDRTGQWVVALMFGLLMVGSAPVAVGAEEQAQEQEVEIEEVTEQATVVSADPSDAIMWVANTPEQVATEIEKQSDEKDQDPLSDYTIVWGDTLWAISLATGTTVEELAEINNIENPDLIYAGDLLTLADGTVVSITPEQDQADVEQNSTHQEDEQVAVKETTSEEQPAQTGTGGVVADNDPVKVTPDQTPVNDKGQGGGTGTVVEDTGKDEVVEDEVDVDNEPEEDDTGNFGVVEGDSEDTEEEPTPEPEPTPTPEEDLDDVEKEVVKPETEVEVEETEPEVIPDDTGEVEVEEPSETPVEPEEDPVVSVTDPEEQEPGDEEQEVGDEEQEVVVTTQVETITEILGNKVIRRGTNELPVGEERVVQEGNFGQRVQQFLITLHDGVQFGDRELIRDEVVLEPVDKIVEFGTHVEQKPVITTSTRTETENLPFERVTIGNPEMWEGDTKVVQTGSFGKVVREYKVTYKDGVEVSSELVNETRTESVNEVIHLGTKPVVSTKTRTETETVAFDTVERDNANLLEGQTRVAQEGVNGERTITYEQTYIRGEFDSEKQVTSEITKQPVNKIIEVGTKKKPVITTDTRTVTENLPFERVTIGNPEMWEGDTKVVHKGSFGKVVKEYKVTYSDGVEVSVELINETRTEPVNEVIHLGTKPVESTKTRTETEVVPFETVTQENPNLSEGETRVVQEGVNGVLTTTFKQTYIRGEFDSEKQVSSEITKQPVNKIIEVGTKKKPVITTDTRTVTQEIEFDVEVVEVSYLPVGQEMVVTEGRNGQREIVYKQTFHDGVLVDVELLSDEVTRQPVTKVVHVGVEPSEIVLDQQVFSQELLKLVNELRVSVGVHELTYDNTLQEGANIRAREVLDVFSHTRPDGRHFITAFGYEDGETNYYLGENIATNFITEEVNVERIMAKKFFNQYYNSEGHYNNMISDRYVTFATGVAIEGYNKLSNVQIFGTKSR